MLGDSDIKEMLLRAEVESLDPTKRDLAPWLGLKTETRREVGRWLPDRHPTLLVTVEVLNTSHCAGQTHHIIAVADAATGELLTPAYHYVSDTAERRILHTDSQDVLIYQGVRWQHHVRTDMSLLIIFAEHSVIASRPICERAPDSFFFRMSEGDRFWVEEQKVSGWPDKTVRTTIRKIPLQWNRNTLTFDVITAKEDG
jgi:hypothetical protein